MDTSHMEKIWVEQCDAARGIKQRYGVKAAFDYLVAEKLRNHADAAASHPAFARELPSFVSQVRLIFTPQELQSQIALFERELLESKGVPDDEDDPLQDSPERVAQRASTFIIFKDLLIAGELGTS
jgi:hypothetical protein